MIIKVGMILSLLWIVGCAHQSTTPTSNECAHDATTFRCVEYLGNYDGDTTTFNIKDVHPIIGKRISVRVNGIDTPEIKGKLPCEKEAAQVAKLEVENFLKNAKRIDLTNVAREKYFRILADVIADGQSVGEILLQKKLAYPYQGKTKEKLNWCAYKK